MKKQFMVGAFVLVLGLTSTAYATHNPNHNPPKKYFVCKYVGTPGTDERLQTGQNPISVSENALTPPVVVGAYFNDAQGRSVAVAEDTGQDEPTCPTPQNVVDVCPNLEGNQATVPEGFRLEGKNCLENDGEPARDPDPVKKEVEVKSTTTTPVAEQETEAFQGK